MSSADFKRVLLKIDLEDYVLWQERARVQRRSVPNCLLWALKEALLLPPTPDVLSVEATNVLIHRLIDRLQSLTAVAPGKGHGGGGGPSLKSAFMVQDNAWNYP